MPPEAPAPQPNALADFLAIACKEGLWSTPERLARYAAYVFADVPLEGRRMLDIGGGKGVFTLYAAARGACHVICLEPEAAGSRKGMRNAFYRVAGTLPNATAEMHPWTLQEYQPPTEPFDVILLHNSINHLDEEACIALRRDPAARATYRHLFQRIASMLAPAGDLVLTDGTPHNLWPKLGLRNPFAPTIEWHKHQPPEVWRALAEEVGLRYCCLKWTSPSSLGEVGRTLLGNRLGAFLTLGAFRLHLRKPAPPTA